MSPHLQTVLAPNPGPMTLDGTNTYLVRSGDHTVVVDPGPDDAAHVAAVLEHTGGRVDLILVTHRHHDHTGASAALSTATGAPVRAAELEHCHGGGEPLRDGEQVRCGDLTITVVATPGHTADSVSFLVQGSVDGEPVADAVLTGDTILGRGTTVLARPDGTLTDYLNSLDRLDTLGDIAVLPAHGPRLPSLTTVVAAYREHRLQRLAQVSAALDTLGADAGVAQVTDLVYADVDPAVRGAAEQSVQVQLEHLRGDGAS